MTALSVENQKRLKKLQDITGYEYLLWLQTDVIRWAHREFSEFADLDESDDQFIGMLDLMEELLDEGREKTVKTKAKITKAVNEALPHTLQLVPHEQGFSIPEIPAFLFGCETEEEWHEGFARSEAFRPAIMRRRKVWYLIIDRLIRQYVQTVSHPSHSLLHAITPPYAQMTVVFRSSREYAQSPQGLRDLNEFPVLLEPAMTALRNHRLIQSTDFGHLTCVLKWEEDEHLGMDHSKVDIQVQYSWTLTSRTIWETFPTWKESFDCD